MIRAASDKIISSIFPVFFFTPRLFVFVGFQFTSSPLSMFLVVTIYFFIFFSTACDSYTSRHAACTFCQPNTKCCRLKSPNFSQKCTSFLCCCLYNTNPVKYITSRSYFVEKNIADFMFFCFFQSQQHVLSALVLQKKTQASEIDYLIHKAVTL